MNGGDLSRIRKIIETFDCRQSQGALASQAYDCFPIVEALGYYDLADHLRQIAGVYVFPESGDTVGAS